MRGKYPSSRASEPKSLPDTDHFSSIPSAKVGAASPCATLEAADPPPNPLSPNGHVSVRASATPPPESARAAATPPAIHFLDFDLGRGPRSGAAPKGVGAGPTGGGPKAAGAGYAGIAACGGGGICATSGSVPPGGIQLSDGGANGGTLSPIPGNDAGSGPTAAGGVRLPATVVRSKLLATAVCSKSAAATVRVASSKLAAVIVASASRPPFAAARLLSAIQLRSPS